MKKLAFILSLIYSISSFAQKREYPMYGVDSLGHPILIMTVEQATSIDNDLELLELFKKMNAQIGQYDSACIKAVNDKEKVIAVQKIKIAKLDSTVSNRDQQILSLQKKISEQEGKIQIMETMLVKQQQIIDEKNKQLRKIKIKLATGGIGGSAIIIGLVVGLLLLL